MDKDKRDPFVGLGWRAEMVRLANLFIPFNPLSECGVSGAKQFCDDYKMTTFLQSI